MAEPLFGSAHPIWPAMPATAFGYFQTPLAGRGLPLGAPTGTLTTDPYGAFVCSSLLLSAGRTLAPASPRLCSSRP